MALGLALLGACASQLSGYGVGPQAERQAMMQQADKPAAPDTPGMYLGLIDRMQQQGLYFASLAHIDAYEKQYGVSPDTIALRADALRMTDQPAAGAAAYAQLLQTPLAARGHRGLGLIAGSSGDFPQAVQQLQQAAQLVPTDAVTLSDLGYAQLRAGDVNGARVPLMKAVQLDQNNHRIMSNVVLYLLADGEAGQAQALMNQQKMAPDVCAAIRSDAKKVVAAERAKRLDVTLSQGVRTTGSVASIPSHSVETAPRLLQWFAQ
ncbi:pilus assembly protein [Paraburkholderia acidicola]|uniref:Pilus assembly protein n=1 Tax=Paraburkholderia acidicola TaxID=1912599 RepID=A0A2A4F1N6_9BURK|nr:pilus assembly protein [Paraburkholderia acidicola]PCE26877.1 pilus assembly protein [Paraburkholderia acidicola]